jgi:uncharacterized protein (DUF1330 family)
MTVVRVFFYGSYMNRSVLQSVGLEPAAWEVATLGGFDVRISPRANLVRSDRHTVWGIVATATHEELARLYAHAKDVLGEVYLPEAVIVHDLAGRAIPALCYICPEMQERPAERDYVERILAPARAHGFPAWYLQRLESFLGSSETGAINPTRAQFDAFKALPRDRPIHMLNLIRLRPDGADSYRAYGRESAALFQRLGGRIVWSGRPEAIVIGPDAERWDIAFIAEYPHAGAFLAMVTDPAYREHSKLRTAAVEDSRLIRLFPTPPGDAFGS